MDVISGCVYGRDREDKALCKWGSPPNILCRMSIKRLESSRVTYSS